MNHRANRRSEQLLDPAKRHRGWDRDIAASQWHRHWRPAQTTGRRGLRARKAACLLRLRGEPQEGGRPDSYNCYFTTDAWPGNCAFARTPCTAPRTHRQARAWRGRGAFSLSNRRQSFAHRSMAWWPKKSRKTATSAEAWSNTNELLKPQLARPGLWFFVQSGAAFRLKSATNKRPKYLAFMTTGDGPLWPR